MHLRPTLVIIGFVMVASLGQLHTQQAYQQSVKTSTTYSTEVVTVYTAEYVTVRRTSVSTFIYPPPPDLRTIWEFYLWHLKDTNELTRVEIMGNVTNSAKIRLASVSLEFEVSEGYKSEVFTHTVSNIDPGQRRDFRFNYTPGKDRYDVKYTAVIFKGFEYSTGFDIQSTTMVQTSTREEVTRLMKPIMLTSVRTVLFTYTESGSQLVEGTLKIAAIIATAAITIAVFGLRHKPARKTSISRARSRKEHARNAK